MKAANENKYNPSCFLAFPKNIGHEPNWILAMGDKIIKTFHVIVPEKQNTGISSLNEK